MDKTINYLKSILKSKDVVVVGVSSGPDSMCLLHLLCDLKKTIDFKIVVCHMNHKVRIEADEEASFVESFAKDNDLIYEYYELKKKIKSNFHSEARIIRYEFFNDVIKKYNANYLMTAHHGDDLIETILMRIQRGSNLKGYSGFELLTNKDNYKIVKPLIFYTKENIIKYMDDNNYKYYIDNTNNSDDYLRNRYRHHVLPQLYKEYELINDKYLKFSNTIIEADSFINKYVNNIINNLYVDNILDINKFNSEDKIIKDRILEYILSTLYIKDLYLVNDNNINEIYKMIESNKPSLRLNLPSNHIIEKEYDKLYVDKVKVINNIKSDDLYYEDNNVVIKRVMESNDTSNNTIRLNSKELKLPIYFGQRLNGDLMYIKNFNHSKKLKDILIDLKIPKEKRNNIPILYDNNHEVIWIASYKKSKYDKSINENYDIILKCEQKYEKNI